MEQRRKNLTQLFIPICLETLLYMLSGMVDTLMLSSVNDQAVGAVGTANTYIGIFIIMFIFGWLVSALNGKVQVHDFQYNK
jgi:Na+-driven multidrug efflux pump